MDHKIITAERGRRAEDLRAAAIAALEQQSIASGMLLDLDDDTCVAAGPKAAILMLLNGDITPAATSGDAPDLQQIKALALAATPQNLDTAEDSAKPTGYIECPECGGEGSVELTADYCNYDGKTMGVQFYGVGPEHRAAEAFFRAASPAVVLDLIARIERLQAGVGHD